MMRKYTPKDNVQKQSYYTDRYYVPQKLPKIDVESDEVFKADVESLKSKFEILECYIQLGQLVVIINHEDGFNAIKHLKEECGYDFLTEMSAIDWLAQKGQFEVFYQLLSTSKRKRMRLKYFISENQAVNSVESIFKNANWAEREMYDMFGIKLNNHPYPKRILMPDDWSGHPLRKTYPLQGDEAASWYEVDLIFGKEARDIIGPEIRDSAAIDRYDSKRFARLGKEVPFGADVSENITEVQYQEKGGVFLVEKFTPENSKILDKRR